MTKVIYSNKAMSDVNYAISQAHESYQKTRNKVQVAAVSVLRHAFLHGDYSKANDLINGLQGLNQTALVEFFVKFGGFKVGEDEKGFVDWNGKEFIEAHFQEAKKVMWWELKVQSPYKGFNLKQVLALVISNAEKAQEKVSKDESIADKVVIEEAMLEQLRAIAA